MKRLSSLFVSFLCCYSILVAQSPLTSLPFEVYGDHVFIKIKVNNSRDLNFIFDTGDGLTVLNIKTAQELGMSPGSEATTTSAEGTIKGNYVKHQKIEINNLELKNVNIYETSLSHLEISIGKNIDGIIGYDMLKAYTISMNYDKKIMDLYDSPSYKYSGTGKAYDVKLTSLIPHIKADVILSNGEKVSGEFFVNTGAKTTVDFNTPFVAKNGMTSKVGKSYIYLVSGLGTKEYEHHEGKVNKFTFSDFSFENMPVGLSHAKSGLQNHKKMAGIIGGGLLRKFNIVYNYGAKKMYWEKNESYATGFAVNASGLELQLSKDKSKVLIHKVFENSSATAAGIKVNSELNEVDGKSAKDLGLAEIRKMLKQDGKTVSIKVDGKQIDLMLKALI